MDPKDLARQSAIQKIMNFAKGAGQFGKGVATGLGNLVKPYASMVAEAGVQGARSLIDPVSRKATFQGFDSLTPDEINTLANQKQSFFINPDQIANRQKIAGYGAAATLKAGLATTGAYAGIPTLAATAGLSGGLGYLGAKMSGSQNPLYDAGVAAGESPIYAGVNKITSPITGFVGSKIPWKGFVPQALIRGGTMGAVNVAEDQVTTPLLYGRNPTMGENALSFGVGGLMGAGEAASPILKNFIKNLPKKALDKAEKAGLVSVKDLTYQNGKYQTRVNGKLISANDAPTRKQLRDLSIKEIDSIKGEPIGKLAGYNGKIDLATADKVRTDYQSLAQLDDIMKRGGRGAKVRFGYQADKLADSILIKAVDEVDDKTFRRIVKDSRSKITNALNIAPYLFEDPQNVKRFKLENETMYGALAGVTYEKDENGNYQMKYNPEAGIAGMAIAGGIKSKAGQNLIENAGKAIKNTVGDVADDLGNKYYKSIGEILSNRKPVIDRTKLTGRQLDKSNAELLKAGYGELGTSWKSKVKSGKQMFRDLYTDFVDRFAPVEDLVKNAQKLGGKFTSESDPYKQARVLMGANGNADLKFQSEIKPILNELDGLGIDTQDMDLYLKSRRDINLSGRGILGSDAGLAQQRLEALAEKYGEKGVKMDEIAQKLYDFQNKGFQELVDAGFINPEKAQMIRDVNEDYVPFQRVMDEVDDYLGLPTRKLHNPGKVINKIEGSERQVISPLESIIANIYKQRAAIQKNKVAQSIANLSSISPQLGIRKVKESSNLTMSVWENGRKVFYEVPEDVARAVKGLNEENMSVIFKVLSAPASLMRQGATGRNIDFMIPNMIKDQFDAAVNSNYGYIPFWDWGKGLASIIKKDDVYQQWLKSGGSQSFGELSGKKSISDAVQGTIGKKRFLSKLSEWAFKGIDKVGEYSEQPTRVGAFKRALNKGANATDAALESRDITLDFSRMGAKMKVLNSVIPFLNVEVQAFDKLVKNFKTKPAQTALQMATWGALPVTMTAVYNLYRFPTEYADIPEWEKDDNLILIKGRREDKTVDYIKIPLGNIASIATKPTRAFIEYLAGQGDGSIQSLATNLFGEVVPLVQPGNSLGESFVRTLGSNMPQIVKPAIENTFNRSFYKWNQKKNEPAEIVPFYLKDKKPPEQAYENTEAMYKYLGNVLNVSPLQVKNMAEGYLAGFAKTPANVLEAFRAVADNKPVKADDVPVYRRFVGEANPQKVKGSTQTSSNDGQSFGEWVGERFNALTGTKDASAASKEVAMTEEDIRSLLKSDGKTIISGGKIGYTDGDTTHVLDIGKVASMPETTQVDKIKKTKARYQLAKKLLDSNVESDKVQNVLNQLNIDPENATYYLYASSDGDIKNAYIQDRITEYASKRDRAGFLTFLADGRKYVAGSQLVTNGMVDDLNDMGLITDQEKKILKTYTFANENGRIKITGRATKATFKAPKAKKMSIKPYSAPKSSIGRKVLKSRTLKRTYKR